MDSAREENASAGNTLTEQTSDRSFYYLKNRSKQPNVPHNVSRVETTRGSMGNPLVSGYSNPIKHHTPHAVTGPTKRYGSNFEDYRA